jgi:hypothetical protein
MNCHVWMEKYFRLFFWGRVPPCGQNRVKILYQPDMTIHTPIESREHKAAFRL